MNVIKIGKFEYDTATRMLSGPDEVGVRLPNKTHLVLMYFYEHRNEEVASKDIMMEIWGDDTHHIKRSMDVYIAKVRSLLKADSNLVILSSWGIGYKFVVST